MSEGSIDAASVSIPEESNALLDRPTVTAVSAHFKLIIIAVLAIFLITLGAGVAMSALMADPNESAKKAIDTCFAIAQLCVGAFVGLLGGKAV